MNVSFRRALALILALALIGPFAAMAPSEAQSAPDLTPKWHHQFGFGNNRGSSPAIADVNGDGIADIVYGDQGGHLHVLNAGTGGNLPGWPVNVGSAIDSSPAVADLDNDGTAEIVVGLGSNFVPNQRGGVRIYNRDGGLRCHYDTLDYGHMWSGSPAPDGRPDAVFSSPAIGDVDGDGRMDIVFGGFDLHLHAIDRNCGSLSGFPYLVEDSTWSSPALYDVDGDGRMEIFIGSDQTAGGAPQFNWDGGEFRSLDHLNGQVVERWKQRSRDVFHSSPAIGDINGDGRLEVVVGGGDHYHHPEGRLVWAWHIDDGSPVPGWPQGTFGAVFSSPALGDLDGDGVAEVVVASRDGTVYAWRGNGSLLWYRGHIPNCCVNPPPTPPINASPIIADLDGDGDQDVAIGTGTSFHLLDGRTGAPMAHAPAFGWSWEGAAAVGDFGPHGRLLVVSGFITGSSVHRIAAYPIAGTTPAAWPMFRKDPRHLAAPPSGGDPLPPGYCTRPSNPPANPSAASASGYWMLGRDGGIFSFGSAGFKGSLPGIGVTASAVAMAPRKDGSGYWVVDDRGLLHAFGGASSFGDMRGHRLNAPVIGLEPTPSGNGYWLLGADGGIFTFGDAQFYGSTGAMRLNAPVIAMAATPTGNGYWLLGADGGIFTFGDAQFYGSTGAMRLNAPVISMAVHPSGTGYWLLGGDGGVFTFGSASFWGSVPGSGLCAAAPAVQIRASGTGGGYWLLGADGAIFAFGDAIHLGAFPGLAGARRASDLAVLS